MSMFSFACRFHFHIPFLLWFPFFIMYYDNHSYFIFSFLVFCAFVCWNRVFLYSPRWPRMCHVCQVVSELETTFLSQCWNFRHMPSKPAWCAIWDRNRFTGYRSRAQCSFKEVAVSFSTVQLSCAKDDASIYSGTFTPEMWHLKAIFSGFWKFVYPDETVPSITEAVQIFR